MSFENRWMIVGTLTTTEPLHIGNGDVTHRDGLFNASDNQSVDINAVCVNKDGRAYIPGTTLKGNLRAWAKIVGLNTANFENLFGSDDPEKESSVGGKIEIYDASAVGAPEFSEENQPPYWDELRYTGVIAGVAIDRRTRTASEERLFYHEFVPPGVSFAITITGQNLTDAELEDLLFVLAGFNKSGVLLGAGEEDGWGAMTWELTDLRCIIPTEVAAWINAGAPKVGYAALASLSDAERQLWLNKVNARLAALTSPAKLTLDITLQFDSHFLVNDPSRAGSIEEGKTSQTPLFDVNGRLLLPASSFRGALRSQAEKILRTMRGEQAACYPDNNGPRSSCEAVYEEKGLAGLCLACKVFGAPGWKSPITLTSFTTATPVPRPRSETAARQGHESGKLGIQEFVAIDRFTGGGAHGSENAEQPDQKHSDFRGKKFNAASVYKPQLSGKMKIDLQALQRAGAGDWAGGLLALTMRDLIEGDIRFGFGAAKGYGAMRAQVRLAMLPHWDDCPDEFKRGLDENLWNAAALNGLKNALQAQIEALSQIEIVAKDNERRN